MYLNIEETRKCSRSHRCYYENDHGKHVVKSWNRVGDSVLPVPAAERATFCLPRDTEHNPPSFHLLRFIIFTLGVRNYVIKGVS